LPEVETHVRDLQVLRGAKILDLKSDTPKLFRPPLPQFRQKILNARIEKIERRAKYLIFTLSASAKRILRSRQEFKMVVHFRMTGHFLIRRKIDPPDRFARAVFELDQGRELRYEDIRKFGFFQLCSADNYEHEAGLDLLGPEPLDKKFTATVLQEILKRKKGKLKAVLLNQTVVAGIGNIYADEICFTAGLRPDACVETLTARQIGKLHTAIVSELKKGVRNRGTTIGEFVDSTGHAGENQNSVRAYQRHGLPCVKCGTILRKLKISQRTTSYCQKCQRG
jgi:formamidopyrimidine-DNA glycosylase